LIEALEIRQLLSTSAMSNLGGEPVSFTLHVNGELQEIVGTKTVNVGSAQGLYQGTDASGDEVVYELANQTIKEFTPTKGWVSDGSASKVVQTQAHDVFFTRGSTLEVANGVPGSATTILSNVPSLTLSGGGAVAQIGSYISAGVSVQSYKNVPITVLFSNVQLNVGHFASAFVSGVISDLQKFTKPLQPLADALTKPLLPGWGFTAVGLLSELGFGSQANALQGFALTISALDGISPTIAATTSWIDIGSIAVSVGSQLKPTTTKVLATASAIQSKFNSGTASALAELKAIPGLQVSISNPTWLLELITGQNPALFSYALNYPNLLSVSTEQLLATIPVSPETLTEIDLRATLGLNVGASATFGADATGFFLQNAKASANISVGIAGIVNEADLAGFQLSGALTGKLSTSVTGANGTGKVYIGKAGAGITFTGPSLSFGITAKFLNPLDMIDLAIQDYGSYLKGLLGTDLQTVVQLLQGKGISTTAIAAALQTLYGLTPPAIASLLYKLNFSIADIATSLYHGVKDAIGSVKDIDLVAGALSKGLSLGLQELTQALSGFDNSVSDVARALYSVGGTIGDIATDIYYWWEGSVRPDLGSLVGALSRQDDNIHDVFNVLYGLYPLNYLVPALWSSWDGTTSMNVFDLVGALSAVSPDDLDAVVYYLYLGDKSARDIAVAVWNFWDGTKVWASSDLATTLGELTSALSLVDKSVSDVVVALYAVDESVDDVANAAWHWWNGVRNWTFDNLAGVLSTVDESVSDIVEAIYSVDQDLVAAAHAVWYGWQGFQSWTFNNLAGALSMVDDSVFDVAKALYPINSSLTVVAHAIWYDWADTVNWTFGNLAGALSAVDDSVFDVVKALYPIDTNLSHLAQAVWNDWVNVVNWNLNDLSGVLSSVDDSLGDVVGALSSVCSNADYVASAVWHDWENTKNWSLNSLEGILGDVGGAVDQVWNVVTSIL
jgi:hypothetical protein